jgi:hypothetical protein
VIKRIGLLSLSAAAEWSGPASFATAAPAASRPARLALCTPLHGVGEPPPHDGVVLEWFHDREHLARFEEWLDGPAGRAASGPLDALVDPGCSAVLVVDEVVARGAGWLEERWRRGGSAFKHMALARRGLGLTPEEFTRRWGAHAGRVGGAGAATPIPEEVRGRAYVQDHPVPRAGAEWAYDAVNEVWFDDLAGLRRRVDWFRRRQDAVRSDPLFSESWMLAVREDVVSVSAGPASVTGG